MSIRIERQDRVLQLVFDRLDKKNALTQAMYTALADALDKAADDAEVRAVVFSGSADCFSAGNDIQDFLAGGLSPDAPVLRFLRTVVGFEKPLVAAVAGPAIGIGTTLLFHCDLVYAAPSTVLKTPFVDLALVPEAASSLLMPAGLGYQRAAGMLLLGEAMSADEAHVAGLVNRVVAAEELLATALDAARRLAAKPPAALRLSKSLMRRGSQQAVAARLGEEAEVFVTQLASPEAKEAFTAFLERRAPDFSRFA